MFWKWTKRVGIGLGAGLATLAVGGALYQEISTRLDAKKYPPLGELVDVGGYKMHLYTTGTGGPTVVLDAGLGNSALGWSLVQPEIAKFARVVSFDRPGNGWSDESPLERTSQNIVAELHTALHKANIPGPYVLVGHSFGGLNARLFSSLYPDEVLGVVLVDSAHEDQAEKIPMPPMNHTMMKIASHLGVVRLFTHLPAWKKTFAVFPQPVRDPLLAKLRTTKFMRSVLQERSHFKTSCDQLKAAGGHLGDKPLTVISAVKAMPAEGSGFTQEQIDTFL
ncbi:MAG TPA: alpha/beta hydrolase, partial [Chlamydiales bacterium]|nr:alpha/beta hydrolase [Chlamydiales bacterium]